MRTYLFVVLVALGISAQVFGQERLGISNSNYSSTNSIFLNPSSSVDSKTYMQLNLVGANAFISSNMAYLPKFSAWSLLSGAVPDPVLVQPKGKEYLIATVNVEALSYVISTMEYGLGVFFRVRSVANAKNIPYDVATQLVDPDSDLENSTPQRLVLKNAALRNMSWAEYGINAGKLFRREPNDLFALSANLKYLTGININYKLINELDATLSDTLYQVDALQAKDRYNDVAWNSGKGFGMDLGFTYKKMLKDINNYFVHARRSNCVTIDYKYKIGVSLLDLGFINFKKNTYSFDVDTSNINAYANEGITNNLAPLYTLNKPIWAVTPSALALQGDYNFENSVFLNLTVIKNLVPDGVVGVQGSNLLCVTPRYETKNFEVSLPFTLQRFRYPHLGVGLRFRSLVVGVDNVIPFVTKANTKQFGVYFNLGISLFNNPACNTKRKAVDDCAPGLKNKIKSRIGKYMHKKPRKKK